MQIFSACDETFSDTFSFVSLLYRGLGNLLLPNYNPDVCESITTKSEQHGQNSTFIFMLNFSESNEDRPTQ